jgi:ataxin-3
MESTAKYVYFEKQGGDMMCGVHCINALLQGPYFDEVTMGQIAVKLDQEEAALMGGGTKGDEAARAMGDLRKGLTSHNVANDGNFSIQVINAALVQFGQIDCVNISNKEV